ncbi:MAG: DMT family transporter [Bacteroidia bacterium]|nr:DMT family transporter [Bacteroidia bacterium]
MANRDNIYPHLALLAVALAYTFNYFIAKWVFDYIGAFGVVAIRNIVGSSVFFIIGTFVVNEKITDKKDYLLLAACSLFGIVINQLLFFKGLSLTVELNASVLMITSPVFVFIISAIWRTESLSGLKALGLLLSFGGALLLILSGRTLSLGGNTLLGDIFVFINSASYGVYLVIVRPLAQKYHPLTIVKWIFLMGGLIIIPMGTPDLLAVNWGEIPVKAYWSLLYIVTFTTVLVYSFNAYALSKVNPSVVSIYIYLQPVLVAFLSIFFAKGQLNWEKGFYIFLVFVGVFAVTYRKKTI